MCHIYTGQCSFYSIDPHSTQPFHSLFVPGGNNANYKGNVVLGIGSVPFPRFAGGGTPTPILAGPSANALALNGGLTGGVSKIYWPASSTSSGMSPADSICFQIHGPGNGVLHTLQIYAYK